MSYLQSYFFLPKLLGLQTTILRTAGVTKNCCLFTLGEIVYTEYVRKLSPKKEALSQALSQCHIQSLPTSHMT